MKTKNEYYKELKNSKLSLTKKPKKTYVNSTSSTDDVKRYNYKPKKIYKYK